jgi:hypothetical protein
VGSRERATGDGRSPLAALPDAHLDAHSVEWPNVFAVLRGTEELALVGLVRAMKILARWRLQR